MSTFPDDHDFGSVSILLIDFDNPANAIASQEGIAYNHSTMLANL